MAEQRDPIVELTGTFGKWQLQAILIIFLCKIPTSWFMAIVLFTAPTPEMGEFWCRPPAHLSNHSHADRLQALHPIAEAKTATPALDYCNVYREIYDVNPMRNVRVSRGMDTSDWSQLVVNNSSTLMNSSSIVPCTEFEFNVKFHSVVAEFGLVCGRKFLNSLAHCFHILGLLIGGVLAFYFHRV